ADVAEFQVSVTYLFASSLVLTGLLQFLFTRFVADRLFEDRRELVVPNLMGTVLVTTLTSGGLGSLLALTLFHETSWVYRGLMLVAFVTMSNSWLVVILLTALKAYRRIVLAFSWSYLLIIVGAWMALDQGLEGLLLSFVVGQALLLFSLFAAVTREFEVIEFFRLDFVDRALIHPDLAWTGLLYNLAVWADKAAFWFHPRTGGDVIGPLRASAVYDVPIFLAYLTIVPGMAVFLVRMETDFSELYEVFYSMVREGAPLGDIERTRDRMIETVRQGIYEILKIQGITLALAFLFAPRVLSILGISEHYLGLFFIDSVGVAAQVLFLSILNVLFYLDQRRISLLLCLGFFLLNVVLTLVTQALGPAFYGYGFTLSGILVVLVGLSALSRRLEHLVRETFMLQSVTR
ncbi:MAG: exopolysaccharide Pel transporter PelG, partial [Myxococcota bacterium]